MVARAGSVVITERSEYESIPAELFASAERRAKILAELFEGDLARRMFIP